MSLLAESSPRSRTWRANSDATSVTTTTPPNPSSGPTATPHIESLLIPFHPLQATSRAPLMARRFKAGRRTARDRSLTLGENPILEAKLEVYESMPERTQPTLS